MDESIDLTPYAAQVDSALEHGKPCMIATCDSNGHPDIGIKGSLLVFDRDHLAYLERTHRQHLENLHQNPQVAVMFYDREAEAPHVRFYGTAELLESGEVRDAARNRVVPAELSKDPENTGIIVMIRVDRIVEPRKTVVRTS